MNRSICVYCGSSDGVDPIYRKAADALGRELGRRSIGLVFGGGIRGMMGAVARGVKAEGGHVTGIIPRFLMRRELGDGDPDLFDDFVVVETMHERKHLLFERSDAFVAMPGGIGTLEEIVEIMTWAQLGHHDKPIVLASILDFWAPMERLLEHMTGAGFIHTAHRLAPTVVGAVEEIVPAIEAGWKRPPTDGRREDEPKPAPIEKL